ncbi:MAG: glycoside hydrolase family 2 TIM barrel-domain containing protein [Elusimicrobiota bacterium]
MKKTITLFLMLVIAVSASAFAAGGKKGRVQIKDGWFYVDGEKFFVKGMCYFEHHGIDGKLVKNSPEMTDYDFRMIKEAGFNTIKSALTAEQIEIARKHGLMVVNPATMSCFTEDYVSPAQLKMFRQQIDDFIGYSKKYDNILYYCMDNEPAIYPLYYTNAEKKMENFWRACDNRVNELRPGARTSVQMMPPTAFADVSMTDVASLNLYPFNPAANSIDYTAYAGWYRRAHAGNRPFMISEYGWTENVKEFGPWMMQLLDDQIKAGASGSYLFIWHAWSKEKENDNWWWGIVPNNGKAGDYKNTPRPIYYDYQKYFEAVAIEPKARGVYANKLPFEIYGTEKTGSVSAIFGGRTIHLKKKGKYWWVGEAALGPEDYRFASVDIEAKNASGNLLVRKNIPVVLRDTKRTMTVKIARGKKNLTQGDTYEAKITVTDERGKRVSGAPLKIGVNQSADDPWSSMPYRGETDKDGEYTFKFPNVLAGYFHLMAGVDPALFEFETFADVDILRVEMKEIAGSGEDTVVINDMGVPGMWKTAYDNGSKISLSRVIYATGKGVEISYDLGPGKWVSIDECLWRNLSKFKGIRFIMKDKNVKDRIEVKLIDKDGSNFITFLDKRSKNWNWADAEIAFADLQYGWGGNDKLNLSDAKLSFAVSREGDKKYGPGKLTIGRIEAYK